MYTLAGKVFKEFLRELGSHVQNDNHYIQGDQLIDKSHLRLVKATFPDFGN